jgi:hypothetical protein
MKTLMRSMFTLTFVATALSACGGGGGDSSTDTAGKSAAVTSIAQMAGTYVMPCTGKTFPPSSDPTAAKSESQTATIVISADAASGKATISARRQIYLNSTSCEADALNFDLTFLGTAVDKTGSKNYTNAAGKPVTASVATIAYTGLKFSKGNLTFSLPMPGATTDMAYVLENNTLYLSKGPRDLAGLGDALTPGAVKQQ